jgi:hypothetical protein
MRLSCTFRVTPDIAGVDGDSPHLDDRVDRVDRWAQARWSAMSAEVRVLPASRAPSIIAGEPMTAVSK